jgi:hypothetical protein
MARRSIRNWEIKGSPEKVRKSQVRARISRQYASGTKRAERDWVSEAVRAAENAANHCLATALVGGEAPSLSRVRRGVFGTGSVIAIVCIVLRLTMEARQN